MSEKVEEQLKSLSVPQGVRVLTQSLAPKFTALNERLKNVSNNIQSISQPVKELELQRANAKQALLYVEDIITFHTKLRELTSAVKFDNLPYAALLCGEISDIPIRLQFSEYQEFIKIKQQVCEKVKKTFGEALSENNKQVIEQYAGLFHHLQLGREGIESYIRYIIESLKSQFSSILDLLSAGGNFEDCLVKIYRLTVKQYESQLENITKEFEISGTLELLQKLQRLVDEFCVIVLGRYLDHINKKYKTQNLCEEITKIIKHSESFEIYISKLGKKLVESGARVEHEDLNKENGLLKMSALKAKVFELANFYISVESQLMQESVGSLIEKIVVTQVAEIVYQEKSQLVTGPLFERLDDSFFIIQNACTRVLSTFNVNSICAILNNISTLISESILNVFNAKYQSPQNRFVWSAQFSPQNSVKIIILNLLSTTNKCIRKIVNNLDQQFLKIFGDVKADLIMFQNCIGSISDSENRCKRLVEQMALELAKSFNYSSLLSGFRSLSYDITLEQHSDYEVNDPFALKLVKDVKSQLKQPSLQLSNEVSDILIEFFIEELTNSLEKELKNKRFNELGALQFQKDTREIISQIQNLTSKPVRYRFARLRQVSELLLAADESEVRGLARDTEWKLTERETKLFRSLRI